MMSLLFLPSIVWAIECKEPLVCTLKASEVCKKQDLKLFGKDECVECGCPKDKAGNQGSEEIAEDGETACCFKNRAWDGEEYRGENAKLCGCPKDEEGNQGTLMEGSEVCCFNGNTWNSHAKNYPNSLFSIEKCGCPKGGYKKEDDSQEKICCKDGKKWDVVEEEYKGFDLACGCADEWKKQIDGIELCCTNELPARSPVCPPEKGVPMIRDTLEGICGCGCKTDSDCNTDIWYQFWRKKRVCSLYPDYQCIRNFGCYEFDDLTIVLEERDGLELQPKHLPALAAKLKSKMKLETGEHVKLVINSYSCPKVGLGVRGFVNGGDSETIVIDINHCCEISDGEWTCEGTIVHENEHRQDNYKQPVWYKDLKSKIAQAFANNLTEINAHAKGDINDLIQSYRSCFPESNNFQNVCDDFWAIWPSDKYFLCQKCKTLVPDYLKDFNNSKYAKKYRDDPDYFDPDGGCKGRSYNTCQCRGIRLEVERKYVNSDFARNVYITAQAFRVAACGSAAEEATREDLRNVIEALAECKDWEKPPREDLTDLPMLLAQLYKEKNELCMPAAEIAQNANIAKGLEGLQTCSVIHDFLQANANANLNNLPTTCEDKCEEVTLTSD